MDIHVGTTKKPVKGFEGFYEVDIEGNIYSVERWVMRRAPYGDVLQYVPPKKRKCSLHGTGYLTVRLAKEGTATTHRVHRLVAEAFIPNPDNKPFVNHINGVKTDNRAFNLEWSTEKENTHHAIKLGLKPENRRCKLTGRYLKTIEEKDE